MAEMRERHVGGKRNYYAYCDGGHMINFTLSQKDWGRHSVLNLETGKYEKVPCAECAAAIRTMKAEVMR